MSGFLLDTNVISELIKPKPDTNVIQWVASIDEDLLFLSALTIGEIRKGIALVKDSAKQVRLEAWLTSDLRTRFANRILPLDDDVAERWGVLSAKAKQIRRDLPVIDGLLAATAEHHNLTFVTRNTADVEVTGIRTFNPWNHAE